MPEPLVSTARNTSSMIRPILLIGATGQLGRELLPRLAAWGPVVATAREAVPADDRVDDRVDQDAAVEMLSLDLRDVGRLPAIVRKVGPRVIICAAAYTDVDRAEGERATAYTVNTTAPGVLAEAARSVGAIFVHYSTDYVFRGDGDRPWSECDAPGPVNVYGASKWAGEKAIRASGARHLILRTSWLYGDGGKNFVGAILRRAAAERELRVVADQVGAPTPATFVAEATCRLLGRFAGGGDTALDSRSPLTETVHVSCQGEASRFAWAWAIVEEARAIGLPLAVEQLSPIPSHEYPTPAQRPLNSRLDLTQLRQAHGIEPPHWRAALREHMASKEAVQPATR